MFSHLDHIAILVKDTEEALAFYRDKLGLTVRVSEKFEQTNVRLTHLDLGNLDLQLVEPLTADHPLKEELDRRGECLHHLCLRTESLPDSADGFSAAGINLKAPNPHPAVEGKKALFLKSEDTRGIVWELTGPDPQEAS